MMVGLSAKVLNLVSWFLENILAIYFLFVHIPPLLNLSYTCRDSEDLPLEIINVSINYITPTQLLVSLNKQIMR